MAKTRIGLAAAGADQLPRGGLRDCQPEFKRTCWTTSSRACVACWEASSLTPFKSLRFCACTGGGGRQSWNGQWSPVFLEAFLKIPVDLSHDSSTFAFHQKSNLVAEEPQVVNAAASERRSQTCPTSSRGARTPPAVDVVHLPRWPTQRCANRAEGACCRWG